MIIKVNLSKEQKRAVKLIDKTAAKFTVKNCTAYICEDRRVIDFPMDLKDGTYIFSKDLEHATEWTETRGHLTAFMFEKVIGFTYDRKHILESMLLFNFLDLPPLSPHLIVDVGASTDKIEVKSSRVENSPVYIQNITTGINFLVMPLSIENCRGKYKTEELLKSA
jgi:hypothetical protein